MVPRTAIGPSAIALSVIFVTIYHGHTVLTKNEAVYQRKRKLRRGLSSSNLQDDGTTSTKCVKDGGQYRIVGTNDFPDGSYCCSNYCSELMPDTTPASEKQWCECGKSDLAKQRSAPVTNTDECVANGENYAVLDGGVDGAECCSGNCEALIDDTSLTGIKTIEAGRLCWCGEHVSGRRNQKQTVNPKTCVQNGEWYIVNGYEVNGALCCSGRCNILTPSSKSRGVNVTSNATRACHCGSGK